MLEHIHCDGKECMRTLNIAQYGIPMGKFANTAKALLAQIPLNARLCVISCMAKKRLWLSVPPRAYAQNTKRGDTGRVCLRRKAMES